MTETLKHSSSMRVIILIFVAALLASCDPGPSKPTPSTKGDLIVLADVRATSSRVEYVFDRVLIEGAGVKSTYEKGDLIASYILPASGERLPNQMIIFFEQSSEGSFIRIETQAGYQGQIPASGLSVADFEAKLKKEAGQSDAPRP